jgi:hypothetical protein
VVVPSSQGLAARTVCGDETGAQFIPGTSIGGYLVAPVNTSHGERFWNFSYLAVVVSQQSTQRFADCCRRTLLQASA